MAFILLGFVLAALAGCGGGGSSDAAGQASTVADKIADGTITKADLIRKADLICNRTDVIQKDRYLAYEKAHGGAELTGAKEETALRQVVFPPIRIEIKEVTALGTPAADAERVKAILAGWEAALKAVERKPESVMGLSEGPFARPDKLAREYGFKACGQAL